MQQQDSRIFAELLNRVREGYHSQDDLDLLRTRTTSPNTPDYPSSVQHLFRTNAQVETHSISDFQQSTQQKYIIQSIDTVLGGVSDDMAARILTMIPINAQKTMGCRVVVAVGLNTQ